MDRDENRYNDYLSELNRTRKQGHSNESHDFIALNSVNWDALSKNGKMIALDLRCGDGKATVERFKNFLDNVKVVIGIDCSESKILHAKETYKNCKKFDFYHCDLDSEKIEVQLQSILNKYGANKFGVIFGGYILIHLKDPSKLLCKLYNLLQDDGYIIFQEPDDSGKICYPNEETLKTIVDCFDCLPWIEDRFFAKKIPKMLSAAGFKKIECIYRTIDNLNKFLQEREKLFEITFSHRYSCYDCVSEQDLTANANTAKKLDAALDKMKELLLCDDFYYSETRYAFVARKL